MSMRGDYITGGVMTNATHVLEECKCDGHNLVKLKFVVRLTITLMIQWNHEILSLAAVAVMVL